MELNFTGKGSAFYPPFKNTGAYMLSGKALYLIDCGETMFDVLYHKLDLASIEDVYVILTHMHADHVGSLGTLISYFYCLFNKAIHVVYPQETIKQLLTLEGITPLGYHYHETLPENPAGLTAVPVEVKHALDMKCYGYVLSDGTETIYYSGDSSELTVYAYEKIWSELSELDRKIVYIISQGVNKTGDIRESLGVSPQLLNTYRKRLMERGVVDGSRHGKLTLALPRFEEYINMYCEVTI